MKFQILSDLHLEFFNDYNDKVDFIKSLKTDAEYVLAAGDISTGVNMLEDYNLLASIMNGLIFVSGNHEYYYSSKKDVDNILSHVDYATFLNNNYIEIGDIIIIGSTGWNSDFNYEASKNMNDFYIIDELIKDRQKSVEWSKNTYDFFENILNKYKDHRIICMTHNAPLKRCTPDKYKGSALNIFFSNNWSKLLDYDPFLWVYGHLHESKDFFHNNTRCIENSYGYYNRESNINFNKHLIVDV